MTISLNGFEKEVMFISELMKKVGKIILDNYDAPGGVERKGDGTLVTDIDKKVSRMISSALEESFPEYGILDEEGGGKGLEKRRMWIVDPLDNTKGYVEKTNDFGVIIGLNENDETVFGATYNPKVDEFAYAGKGVGSYLTTEGKTIRLRVSESEKIHALVSRTRKSQELNAMLYQLNADSIKYIGGALKTIEVAKGTVTLFLCPRKYKMHSWDLCAPSLILEEAGGKITDVYGNKLDYKNSDHRIYNGVVATNGKIHDMVLERISNVL